LDGVPSIDDFLAADRAVKSEVFSHKNAPENE
jgi:hypothetical protein